MVECFLCKEEATLDVERIEIFSNEGLRLNVSNIISQHFWLKPEIDLCGGQELCKSCWDTLSAFHALYQRVVEAHNYLENKQKFLYEGEDDPLPTGEKTEFAEELFETGEIKVEVNDLDLLPHLEIIEGEPAPSERAQRANRRGRPPKNRTTADADNSSSKVEAKRVKKELTPTNGLSIDDDDDELELPVASLANRKANNAAQANDENRTPTKPAEDVNVEPPAKKKRGRPRKVKVELENVSEETEVTATFEMIDSSTAQEQSQKLKKIKKEEEASDNDADFEPTGHYDDGTADSDSSSTDSDGSLPEVEPPERYAEIPPRRPAVKPKKYKKREKPLVPPKRMTREEIDAKNRQQEEYDRIIKQFFEKLSCPKCNLLVLNFGTMVRHFRASHDEPGFLLCCGKKFFQRKTLVEHIYVHWNPEHFKCSQCGKICAEARSLELHEFAHTHPVEPKEKKTFQCDKCPKIFTTKAAFEYHTYSKHVPKSEFKFACPECKKKLPTERKLKDHIKYAHDPESAIICDKCGKKMRSQSSLKKHHEIEHSETPRPVPVPMQCEICGTWLRHISGLKQHMKTIHEDVGGEHRCHICGKTSTNGRALKRHIYHNHECERKFKCTMCEKAFKRPQDLREHTSTHTGEVLYTCPNCPMTFFSNANMYKHRQRLHRAEWEADRKKPRPPNIMQQAVGATAAMKMQQAKGANSAFFANNVGISFSSQ